jgi:hypothetical protein
VRIRRTPDQDWTAAAAGEPVYFVKRTFTLLPAMCRDGLAPVLKHTVLLTRWPVME